MENLVETIIKHLQKYNFPVTVGEKEKWIDAQSKMIAEYSFGFLNWAYGKYFRRYYNNKPLWYPDKYSEKADYELFYIEEHFSDDELFNEYLAFKAKIDARKNEKPFSGAQAFKN